MRKCDCHNGASPIARLKHILTEKQMGISYIRDPLIDCVTTGEKMPVFPIYLYKLYII